MSRKAVDSHSPEKTIKEIEQISKEIRKNVVTMINAAGSGHPGGSLSAVEIITTLYFYKMRYDPKNPSGEDRDRFILSKGHAAPVLYSAMAEAGYFPSDLLNSLRKTGSALQGHPDKNRLPGIESSSGSLGQGLSFACGVAHAGKIDCKDYRTYVLLGDGECEEGQVWEAAMAAAHHKLDNLTVVLDRNGLQIDGPTEKVMSIEPIADKWASFGWKVFEIDGYDIPEIIDVLDQASEVRHKPSIIIAHTTKGKGVSFMEWAADFHGKSPSQEELNKAITEIYEK